MLRLLIRRNIRFTSYQMYSSYDSEKKNLGNIGSKYRVFGFDNSEEVLDVVEKRQNYVRQMEEVETHDPFERLNLRRGKTGVFEIEDLVEALIRENAVDIFVATVCPEYNYVDYICIVNGKSHKHMMGIAQFVRRLFKQKRHPDDVVPKLEGANSKDWLAIDLGNIALHIFSKEARQLYNLESLWSLGPEYDKENTKRDPFQLILEKHSIYLQDLQPADTRS